MRALLPLLLLLLPVSSSRPAQQLLDERTVAGERHYLTGYPARAGDGLVHVVVEIPAGTSAKWEVEKESGRLRWERRNGAPRVVKYLPYPGNYGMIPRTLLSEELGGDGDPLDVIVLGPAVARGSVVRARILGALRLLDGGEQDDKLLAVQADSPLGDVRDLAQLDERFPGVTAILETWFASYKGPGEMEPRGFAGRAEALEVLDAAAAAFEQRAAPAAPFDGRVVVVTGANRGIGLEFARQLTAAGATVVGTARRPDAAAELAATGARVLPLDVTDAASVAAFAAAVGDAPVDLLINNAGVMSRQSLGANAPDFELVQRALDVNLVGPMRVTQALLPNLLAGGGGQVVNVSSVLGSLERNTSGGFLGYRESKAGLNMFTRSLAAEQPTLVCVAVHPGWVRTDMGGPSAPVTPEQSVGGLLKVIAGLGADDSGRFFQGTDGEELPW
jgi:inorganic pyrophosphatase